jgi:hypothetical protein
MKRIFIFIAMVLIAASAGFAEESVLIDFTKLAADIHVKIGPDDQDTTPNQNRATVMDYDRNVGTTYTQEQKDLMRTSLAINNWDVVLNSSARRIENYSNSYTKEAPSKSKGEDGGAGTVMGVRVHFPVENWPSTADIVPPFSIPAFEPQATVGDDGSIERSQESNGVTTDSRFEGGYGVVKNVGTIKSVAVSVYGLNFPHALYTILIDDQGNEREVFMGYLNFDGWGELVWQNPQYIKEVRNRELRVYPLYPQNTPFVKFGGFRIKRDAANVGGDFIAYFEKVSIIYDKATLEDPEEGPEFENEKVWEIIYDRENNKSKDDMSSFGVNQILLYQERQKQATESFDPTKDVDAEQQQSGGTETSTNTDAAQNTNAQ